MFYLVDQDSSLVKEHEKKSNLRRIVRNSDDKASLRIVEGKTLKSAIKAEEKMMDVKSKPSKAKEEVKAPAPKAKKKKRARKSK